MDKGKTDTWRIQKKSERTSLQGSRDRRRDMKRRRKWSRYREMEIQSVRRGVKKQSDRKGKRMGKLQEAEWVTSRRGTVLPCPPWCGLDGSTTCRRLTHTLLGCIYTCKHAHSLPHFLCPSANICTRIWPCSSHRYLLAAHLGCDVSVTPRWTRFVWPLSGTTAVHSTCVSVKALQSYTCQPWWNREQWPCLFKTRADFFVACFSVCIMRCPCIAFLHIFIW